MRAKLPLFAVLTATSLVGWTSLTHANALINGDFEASWASGAVAPSWPLDSHEAEQLSIAFGRERRRPAVHAAWGGLETHRPGVFYCDPAGNPELIGAAAAARLSAWLGRMESRAPLAAVVDPERCRACKTCITACEYGAPALVEVNGRYTSWIDPAICTGCGTCAAHCPSGAIAARCSTEMHINAMLSAILGFSNQLAQEKGILCE